MKPTFLKNIEIESIKITTKEEAKKYNVSIGDYYVEFLGDNEKKIATIFPKELFDFIYQQNDKRLN